MPVNREAVPSQSPGLTAVRRATLGVGGTPPRTQTLTSNAPLILSTHGRSPLRAPIRRSCSIRTACQIAAASIVLASLLITPACSSAERIDLSRQDSGDRIAVVCQGQVEYLPARRVELVERVGGAGHARYIRRSSNGDLHVMGTGLEGTLLHSSDGGSTWKSKSHSIENMRFLSAFTILSDDTFVIAFMPPGKHRVFIAHSRDFGRTWSTTQPKLDLGPFTEAYAYNSHLLVWRSSRHGRELSACIGLEISRTPAVICPLYSNVA